MRFLDTSKLQFVHVPDSEINQDNNHYAILSHRWGADEDEVSFEDVQLSMDISKKKGLSKLKGFCKLALAEGCRYGWVDTCCIHKGNSSELGEAINSMYQWYAGSKICITYLEDVPQDVPQRHLLSSSWFDRGWTLQELIAPKTMIFCNHDWHIIGTKLGLTAELSRKTKIPESVLSHATKPSACSVAQRMSWAAERTTTRVEDRAYSLMGLFDVYMPMIYGEREKAFLRLQQHIIQKCRDETIFAWCTEVPGNAKKYSGLFAPSPSAYVHCSEMIQTRGSGGFAEVNGELSIPLKIAPHSMKTYSALLHCTHRDRLDDNVSILIAPTSDDTIYVRVRDVGDGSHTLIPSSGQARFIKRQIRVLVDPTEPPGTIFYGFWLRTLQPPGYAQHQTVVLSNSRAPGTNLIHQHECSQGLAGLVRMKSNSTTECSAWSHVHWVKFGFDTKFNPVLWFASEEHSHRLQADYEGALALGPESYLHRKIMWFEQVDTEFPCRHKNDKWTKGAFTITVDLKEGYYRDTFQAINLTISVQLGTKDDFEEINNSGLPLSPMKIWVVDITDTGGVTPEERVRRQEEDAKRERPRRGALRRCWGAPSSRKIRLVVLTFVGFWAILGPIIWVLSRHG